jgi:hypothetical protein
VQHWGIKDHVMKGDVKPTFISSQDMLADGLTKPYSGPMARTNMLRIGMCAGSGKE